MGLPYALEHRIRRSLTGGLAATFFCVSLVIPAAAWLIGIDYIPDLTENRRPAPAPKTLSTLVAWQAFPKALEAYWNDAFGFRQLLILWNGIAHYKLGVSPSPFALVGGESWLFFSGDGVVEKHRGQIVLSSEQLEKWKLTLEARRDWLANLGAHYLFLVAPDKDSIYPELFPARFDSIGPTPFDQLLAYLRGRSNIDVLDLRPALISTKTAASPLYLRSDTHWNDQGAYVGYREIIRRLQTWFPGLKARELTTFGSKLSDSWCGDLGMMTGLCGFVAERERQLVPSPGIAVRDLPAGNICSPAATRCLGLTSDNGSNPRAVVFHDSFLVPSDQRMGAGQLARVDRYHPPISTLDIGRLLGEEFSRSVFAWQHFDSGLVERERPDVVVEEMVERFLDRGPPR